MNPGKWIMGVLLGLDQLGNALVGGSPDETISSRSGRGVGGLMDRFLNLFERNHGLLSIEFTPWGTVDPHHMEPVHKGLAEDWDSLMRIIESPEDLDHFSEEEKTKANRAQQRLSIWKGRKRWQERMLRDLSAGEKLRID